MRIIPYEKARRLRVGAFRQTAAGGRDLVPSQLANPPQDDSLHSGFLDGGTAGFKARDQHVARDIRIERRNAPTLVPHVTLEILLDGCLSYARGFAQRPLSASMTASSVNGASAPATSP